MTLRPEEYAEDALLVEAGFAESRGPVWVLPRVERRCAYLDDQSNRCLIHDDRPRACRDYDCRHEWAARTLLSLLEAQGEGVVGTPPWETVRGP